jgi:hypothetical protein
MLVKGEMMRDGKQWPIGIIAGTIFIVFACAATVYIALMQPVEENDDLMLDYHTLDTNVNDVIANAIIFNQKYDLSYTGEGVSTQGSTLSYRIVNKAGEPVNDAEFTVVLTRPATSKENIALGQPEVSEGEYVYKNVTVPKAGRWNILAKISVGKNYRHMNLQSDTQDKNVYEYGLDKPMRNAAANAPTSVYR